MMTLTTLEPTPNVTDFLTEFYRDNPMRNPFSDRETIVLGNSSCMEIAPAYLAGGVQLKSFRSLERGVGKGSRSLRYLCDLADKHGVTIYLQACPMGTRGKKLTFRQLKQWYTRYGFISPNKANPYMSRSPKK